MRNNSLASLGLIIAALLTTGCATQTPTMQVYAPNEQLDDILVKYVKVATPTLKCKQPQQPVQVCKLKNVSASVIDSSCGTKLNAAERCNQQLEEEQRLVKKLTLNLNCHDNSKPIVNCYLLASELNGLNVLYPNNMRIMMATALLEFELGNMGSSQQLLDILLSKRGAYPEAAILRSRIAMEEGNLTLARSLVTKQLSLTPDNPYLYEMQASYYYIEGKYTQALQSIKVAERFMDSDWRINYHRGIIYEAQQQWYKACKEYTEVLQNEPDNRVIHAKVLLLRQHVDCYVNLSQSNESKYTL